MCNRTKWAVKHFKMAAEGGITEAMCILGVMCLQVLGVSRDPSIAMEYFKTDTEGGHAKAMHNLGMMYYEGDGARKDPSNAMTENN